MKSREHVVIIPTTLSPKPTDREVAVAYILADYFRKDVRFVLRTGHKTADFLIGGRYWELKSPTGNGKRTIQHALQKAVTQSENVVIDISLLKMNYTIAKNKLIHESKFIPRIKRLLVVDKRGKVLVIK